MLRGGVADKLGNEYEDLWVILQFLLVYRGSAHAINYEPIKESGFELSLDFPDHKEWHQSKIRTSNGQWTIHGLEQKNILSDFKQRLEVGEHCVFVSDADAQSIKALSGIALETQTIADFKSALSKERKVDFGSLTTAWCVDEATAFEWLHRCRAEIVSKRLIETHIKELCALLFTDSVDHLDAFRRCIRDRLTHRVSTEELREDISNYGLIARPNVTDATVRGQLDDTARLFFERDESRRPSIVIDRGEQIDAALEWYNSNEHKVLFIQGSAGSGKSLIAAELSQSLSAKGIPVLPFRVDQFLTVTRPKQLGHELFDIECDPASVLIQTDKDQNSVLLIDQLDAVSDASGRKRSTKDLVLKLIQSTNRMNGIKVVLVCRSYDLSNDTQLKKISEADQSRVITIPQLKWETVDSALKVAGVATSQITPKQRSLICQPVCFSTFVALYEATGEAPNFTTLNDLIEQRIDLADREISNDHQWSAWTALGLIAERMSADQTLNCPTAVLDQFSNAKDRLQSEGLIALDRNAAQFQHESYFDVIYARRFVASGSSLIEWLLSDAQHLFRRTQVRQILAYMRATSMQTYLQHLREVLLSPKIRYHIKDATANWLEGLTDPTEAELIIALEISEEADPNRLTRRIIFGLNWMSVFVNSGLYERWYKGKKSLRLLALRRAVRGLETAPHESVKALESYVGFHSDKTVEVFESLQGFRARKDPEISSDFVCRLIEAFPTSAFSSESRLDMRLLGLDGEQAEFGARILATWYRCWMAENPSAQPFFTDDGGSSARPTYSERQIAEHAPQTFITEFQDLILEAFHRIGDDDDDVRKSEFLREATFQGETWIGLLKSSLAACAVSDPTIVSTFVGKIPAHSGKVLLHLKLAAIAFAGETCAEQFGELIDNTDLFEVGGLNLKWRSAADAAKAVKPHLEGSVWHRFEERLFSHKPEHSAVSSITAEMLSTGQDLHKIIKVPWLMHGYKRNGYAQWSIAQRIGFEHFSNEAQPKLGVLKRKFQNEPLPEDNTFRMGNVVSPISSKALEKMSDAAWLKAMAAYGDDREQGDFVKGVFKGGANELANALQARTKKDPERFSLLLPQLPADCNPVYPASIIGGLISSGLPAEDLLNSITLASNFSSPQGDTSIIYLACSRPELIADQGVFDRVSELSRSGKEPSLHRGRDNDPDDMYGMPSVDNLFDRSSMGGEMIGVSACRFAAIRMLEAALWERSHRVEELCVLIEERIQKEDNADLLPKLSECALAMTVIDRGRGLSALAELAKRDLRVVAARDGLRAFNWARCQEAEELEFLIPAMIEHGHPTLQALAYLWVSGEILQGVRPLSDLEPQFKTVPIARRAAAYSAGEYLYEKTGAPLALEWLEEFTNDEDPDVRTQAFRIRWDEVLDRGGDPLPLTGRFIASENFLMRSQRQAMLLDSLGDKHPALALNAAERLVSQARSDNEAIATQVQHGNFMNLGKLIMSAYEGFGDDAPEREQALNLFDEFLEADVFDVDRVIQSYERH